MKRTNIIALAAVVVCLIAVPVYWALTPPMSGGILNIVIVTPEPAYMGYWCSGPPAPPAAHKPRFQSGSDHPCSQREVEVTFERAGGTPVP